MQGTDGSELLETLNAPDVLDHLRGALVTPSKMFQGQEAQQRDQYHMLSGVSAGTHVLVYVYM